MSLKKPLQSATIVADADGRQYHINAAPSELAEKILLVGDPKRAQLTATLFDEILFTSENRGYVCITGKYKGQKLSVVAVGIGAPSAEIVLMEIFQITQNPILLRIGTCGGIQSFIQPGDFVITTGALAFEDTSTRYVYDNYPPVAHHEFVAELINQSKKKGIVCHAGLTAATSSFYAGQGRAISGFPMRNKNIIEDMEAMHVLNFEMESSIVLTMAALNKSKAGCLCIALNNRQEDKFIEPALMKQREKEAVELGLETLLVIEG
jgi:uridine phosphorylase